MQAKDQQLTGNNALQISDLQDQDVFTLLKTVNLKALQNTKKINPDDLSLMELLNGFDLAVAESKPRTDIANHVYRLILKQQREKQQSSIQEISSQILTLQHSQNGNDYKSFDKDESKQFDFQGSFGEEMKHERRPSGKENRDSNQKPRHKFQFTAAQALQKPRVTESVDRFITPSFSMHQQQQQKHKFISSGRQTSALVEDSMRLQLPKLNFSNLYNKMNRESPESKRSQIQSEQGHNRNKAIDSDRAIAFAQYTRRLLLKSWKALYNLRLENANERFLDRIGQQRSEKVAKRKVFKGLLRNVKVHNGHGPQNMRARILFHDRTAVRCLKLWVQATRDSYKERLMLQNATQQLNLLRKRRLFNKLRNAAVQLQMELVQRKTAQHIYRQRYLRIALLGLKYLVTFRNRIRRNITVSKQNNVQRLLRNGINTLRLNVFNRDKQREMLSIAYQLRSFNLYKQALKQIKQQILSRFQYQKLKQCAQKYYGLRVLKDAIDMMKKNTIISKGMNNQRYYIDIYYQKKLKFRMFQYLVYSNAKFEEFADEVLYFKATQYMKQILQAMRANAQSNRIAYQISNTSFLYVCSLLLGNPNNMSFSNQFNQSAVPYYIGMNRQANLKLKQYYMQQVFKVWAQHHESLKQLKNKRKVRAYTAFIKVLKIKARDCIRGLKVHTKQKIFERQIVSKVLSIKKDRKLSKCFMRLKIYHKRKQVHRGQEEAAVEIYRNKLFTHPYMQWRRAYLRIQKDSHQRQRLYRKYFSKLLKVFNENHQNYSQITRFQSVKSHKLIKKALCGLLQNILEKQEKRNQKSQAYNFLKISLLIKTVKGWQHVMPEILQKNRLLVAIKQDRSNKVMARTFNAIKIYKHYRIEKKATDHFMGKAVQAITMKRFYNQWKGKQNKIIGLRLFQHLIEKKQQQAFIIRLQKQSLFQNQMITHMKLFRLFKLLEFTFNQGLKKNVELKYMRQNYALQIQKNIPKFRKLDFFIKWSNALKNRQWDYKLAHFSIIQIKNTILRKYMRVLKERKVWKQLKCEVLLHKKKQFKSKYFQKLRQITRSRANCKEQLKVMKKTDRKNTLISMFNRWANEINEITHIRHMTQRRNLQNKTEIIHQWQMIVQIAKRKLSLTSQVHAFSNHYRIVSTIKTLKALRQQSIKTNKKIQTIQSKQKFNIMRAIILNFRIYLEQNHQIIKNSQQVKRRLIKRMLSSNFHSWMQLVEPQLIKIRVLKYLLSLKEKAKQRSYIQKWVQYTVEGQEIEEIGQQQLERRQYQDKKNALSKLRLYKEKRCIEGVRNQTISDYRIKKQQLKYLTLLRYATKVIQRRRNNQQRSVLHYVHSLYRKSLISLHLKSKKNEQLRINTQQLQVNLQLLYAPRVFQNLKINMINRKEMQIKEVFAQNLKTQRAYVKSFKALYSNLLQAKIKQNKERKAIQFYQYSLSRQCFEGIRANWCERKIKTHKRQILMNTILKIDFNTTLETTFRSLVQNYEQEKEKMLQSRGFIVLNQIRRMFGVFKHNYLVKKQLNQKSMVIIQKHKQLKLNKLMIIWMRALDNEAKVKVMERNKNITLKQKVFTTLLHELKVKLFLRKTSFKIKEDSKLLAFNSLINYTLRNKKMRMAQSEIMYRLINRTLSRSFMSLRYQILIMKNQRVLQAKKHRMTLMKAFSGWKYTNMIDSILRNYTDVKNKQQLSISFTNWFNLFKYQSTQKSQLGNLLSKKDYQNKRMALNKWKKQAYGDRMIDLLQVHFTFPHQRSIAYRCIQAWRKYAHYRQNRVEIKEQIASTSSSLLARRVIREWYEASQNNMPSRILEQRMNNAVTRLQKIKAMYLINVYGHRQEHINQGIQEIEARVGNQMISKYFNQWRKQYAIEQLYNVVIVKQSRALMRKCIIALKINANKSIIKEQAVCKISNYADNVSSDIKLMLLKTFNNKNQNKLATKKLYFQRLLKFAAHSQLKKNMNRTALTFLKQQTKHKYLKKMVEIFMNFKQERQESQQGFEIYAYNLYRKALKVLIMHTYQQRKYRHATSFYLTKLASKTLLRINKFSSMSKQRSQLNTKLLYFLKNKCISLFKEAFTQWRVKFEHRRYGKNAVYEYHNFRNMKLQRTAFDYFIAVIQQKLQVKEMVGKARTYFERKQYLRKVHQVFYALREHSLVSQEDKARGQDRELMGLKFYAFNLLATHLNIWKKNTRVNRNRNKRSKMYALYSAWKFYTKEKVLLRKYLTECNLQGQTYIDPQLMSTQEMRDNASRLSVVKPGSYAQSLSSGTPFADSTNRKQGILSPNGFIMNSGASPQTAYGYRSAGASQGRKKENSSNRSGQGQGSRPSSKIRVNARLY